MTKKEILEKAKSKDGLWVLQRNLTAEKVFPAELLSPEQIYSPVKLMCVNDLLQIISFSKKGTPMIYAYSADQVDFNQENEELILNIKGEGEFYDSYPEPDETRDQFLEHFFHCWNLSPEEHERYGIQKDIKGLPPLGIDRLAK